MSLSFFDRLNPHREGHSAGRAGWLRAAVLGANDGLVSVASLMVGLAAAGTGTSTVVTGGLAALSAGALAMAAGEYVSVSSQVDIESADRAMESHELTANPQAELAELAAVYASRGVPEPLAQQVAEALHERIRCRRTCATSSARACTPPPARSRRPPPPLPASSPVGWCPSWGCWPRVPPPACG
jgi:hypothetical protein